MTPLLKFNDFIDNVYLPYAARSFEFSTYDNYIRSLKAIRQQFGNKRMGFIKKKHILGFIDEIQKRKLKQNTIFSYFRLINAIFNFAVSNKNILKNPCKAIKIKDGNSRAGTLTANDVNILLKYIKVVYPFIHLPVYLSVNTGMRRGEVLGLTWENVNFSDKNILVKQSLVRTASGRIYLKSPKTVNGMRTIAISDEVVKELKSIKKQNKYVVRGWNGGYMDPQFLTNYFNKAIKGSGVPKRRFHDLRHTHASLLLGAGISIKLISSRLGHANIDITLKVYSHLLPNQQHEAAAKFSQILKCVE